MKKILYSSFAVLVAAIVFASCNKEVNKVEPKNDDNLVEVTIIAGNPNPEDATKTELVGGSPYWSVGDAIGVTNGTSTNYKFTTGITSPATSASFTGSTAVSDDLYAYYPYSTLGTVAAGARTEIFKNQNPTATSFDGNSDVMFSKKFSVSPAGTTVSGLEFARAGAILKVVLLDNTTGTKITGQHPSIVSLTATENLVGRVVLDVANGVLGDLYGNQSKTVNANYSSSSWFAIDGTNAAYIIVYPQTLAEGSTLTVYANTEAYAITREITIPSGGIELAPGKITTLKVRIYDANVVDDAGLALPCGDDFSWLDPTGTSGSAISSTSEPALGAFYSTADKVYFTDNACEVKLGTGSAVGYLTTVGIDLSSASHITVSAKQYSGSDGGKIQISVDGGDPIDAVNDAGSLGESYKDYIFNIPAATAKSKITIATSKKRGYINNIIIEEGSYVPPVEKTLPYNNTLISGHTDFSFDVVENGGVANVWTDNSAGVQANGYGATGDVEAYLVSPTIDLTGKTYAVLSFDHRVTYFTDLATAKTETGLQIKVGSGAWTDLAIPYYPASLGNDFISTTVSLDAYVGKKIQLRFKYTATATKPGRWNIKNFLVKVGTHGVVLSTSTPTMGGTEGSTAVVTATSDYPLSYAITEGNGFTVSQTGNVFTFTATADGGESLENKGTVRIKESDNDSYYADATVKQSAATPSGTTVTKTMNKIVEDNSYTVSSGSDVTCYTSFALDEVITISTSGSANCGSFWGTSTIDWRLYQNKDGDITITASTGHTISSVTITYNVSNNGTLKDGDDVVASNSTQAVNAASKTFTVGNTGSAKNGQVRVTKISVTYTNN